MKEFKKDTSNLIVRVINDDSESINETLGITDERAEELMDLLKRCWKRTDTVTGCMELVSKEILHANELFWISFHAGVIKTRMQGSGEESPEIIKLKGSSENLDELMKLLNKLRNLGHRGDSGDEF